MMVDISPTIPVITLNINRWNTLSKIIRLSECIKNKTPQYAFNKRCTLNIKTRGSKVKGWKWIYRIRINQMKLWVATLISENMDLKEKDLLLKINWEIP